MSRVMIMASTYTSNMLSRHVSSSPAVRGSNKAALSVRNPRGAVTFRLPKETFFRVSAARGIKEPALIENFARESFFVGNPSLRPEKTNSFEAGLYREWFGRRVRTDVSYFRNSFQDLIVFDFSQKPPTF